MAKISSDYELDSKGDGAIVDHITTHIRSLLASGLHVRITIEATGESHEQAPSPNPFEKLVKLFVAANKDDDGKLALRDRVKAAIDVSPRTFARREAGQCTSRAGKAVRDFCAFIINGPNLEFTVTEEMHAIAKTILP